LAQGASRVKARIQSKYIQAQTGNQPMAKLNWGMVGGGEGSQIGPAHRLGALADGHFNFAAAALDHRPAEGKAYAIQLGVASDRAYGDWTEMLAGEKPRVDRIDLVTVATPNSTHFEITKAFLEAGFNVLCEKPMTMTVEEGEAIVRIAAKTGKICAVNYCYSAYPMVRQARAMVRNGDIGKVRLVVTNFSHGHHGDATDADNPRVRWRYDPAMAGISGQFADCGIHALHMASFICDDEVETLSADFASTIPSRALEDDAMVNFRMSKGTVGRLWTSSIAIGRQHGFDIQVFGETGGFRWASEQPNQLIYTAVGGRTQIMEKGEGGLYDDAKRLSRVAIAHPEGFPLAVANIYCDLADTIKGTMRDGLPRAESGLRSMAAVHAAVASAKSQSVWTDARPPMFR
jgi:predicted dehydrogenase